MAVAIPLPARRRRSRATRGSARLALVPAARVGVVGYLGCRLGPGPRDGLMTGLHARTGRSLRLVRTLIELSALIAGFALGGTVGIGTVAFALLIGPGVHATFYAVEPRLARLG